MPLSACLWCGKKTARQVETEPARRVTRDGRVVMLTAIYAPCCQSCEQRMLTHASKHRAASFMVGCVNAAREQLSFDVAE